MNDKIKMKTYMCDVCGKTYETVEERNACETKCLAERAKAEAKRKEEELRKEKETRKKEIEDALDHYNALLKAYIKDYGSYSATRLYNDDCPSNDSTINSFDRLFRW